MEAKETRSKHASLNASRNDRALVESMFGIVESLSAAAVSGYDQAMAYGFSRFGIEHLLYGMCSIPAFNQALKGAGGSPEIMKRELLQGFREHRLASGPAKEQPDISPEIYEIGGMLSLEQDRNPLSSESERFEVSLGYILRQIECSALSEEAIHASGGSRILTMLANEGLSFATAESIEDVFGPDDLPQSFLPPENQDHEATPPWDRPDFTPDEIDLSSGIPAGRPEARANAAKSTQKSDAAQKLRDAVLAALRNIGDEVKAGRIDPVIGREEEIDRIILCLQRRRKGGVLISGDAGIGKTAIAEGVALRLKSGEYGALGERPFYEVSMPALMAGTRYRGDFEEKVNALIEMAREEKAILFIDEIHLMMGSGSANPGMDAGNMFKPALARGELTIIGATTTPELRILRRDAAVMRRFELLHVREPNAEETRKILDRAAASYLDFHGVDMIPGVTSLICKITDTYQPEKRFPDKAFDLLDLACVMARDTAEARLGQRVRLRPTHVEMAADISNIRRPRLPDAATSRRLAEIAPILGATVFGQSRAIEEISGRAMEAAFGLSERGAAMGLLLAGPKGSGRKEVARGFARHMRLHLLELDGALIGFRDMSEMLVEELEIHPDLLIHLSNIDQVSPETQATLAEMMRNGYLRLADGRTSSCRGMVFFASIDHDGNSEGGGFGFRTGAEERVGEWLRRKLQPALVEMLDPPILFNRPGRESIAAAIQAATRRLEDRLSGMNVRIHLTPDMVAEMAGQGENAELALERASRRILEAVTRRIAGRAPVPGITITLD
ncbi:AAA family ATPase [Paracoccus litorisediminis]|uniref:AAA family ATPase n=1 Tax=Paracoccus litorisediminis TaxID=2006130 RepID=UPI00372ECD8B